MRSISSSVNYDVTPTAASSGGGGGGSSLPAWSPYETLAEGTPLDALTAARAAGRISAEEEAQLEAVAKARAAAAKKGQKTGTLSPTGSGATTAAASSLPWVGGHVTLGRRP